MSVYKKLQEARAMLHNTNLEKSGENKFARFKYFELGDFIPKVTEIFNKIGLCGVVSFTPDMASLTVHDVDSDGTVVFTSPLIYASVEKTQPIQNLGSTHTYYRRYLWLMAMDIVENDVVDSVEQKIPAKPVSVNFYIDELKATKSPTELRSAYALSYPIFMNNEIDKPKLIAAYEKMKAKFNETSTGSA
jgi:hypothetical protein